MEEDIYGELWPRLLGRGGAIRILFTPGLGNAHKLGYLWTLVDDESLPWAGEIQVPLTLEAVTPLGGRWPLPWMSLAEIQRFEAGLPAPVREMRMGRSRSPLSGQAYFQSWGPHLFPDPQAGAPPGGLLLGVGIDHGSRPGAQRAVLVCVAPAGLHSRVWVLDEYYSDARTESEDDALGIIEMLKRSGYELADVDVWMGDRAHGGDKWGGYKSNTRLLRLFGEYLHIDTKRRGWSKHLPRGLRGMQVPYKYDRSVDDGCEVLHRFMVDRRFSVDPRCVHLDEDLREWQGSRIDPHKDGLDALRYIVVKMTGEKR